MHMHAEQLSDLPDSGNDIRITVFSSLQGIFQSSSYEIHQPLIQILSEGYTITSPGGEETYSANRPRHIFRNILARIGAGIAFIAAFGVTFYLLVFPNLKPDESSDGSIDPILTIGVFACFAFGLFSLFFISKLLVPKRSITLHREEGKEIVLTVKPTSGIFYFNPEYGIYDGNGKHLATFRKKFFESLFRRRWHAHDPQENYLYSAVEDSLFLALFRRFIAVGKYLPMHFSFQKGQGKAFGQFKRRYSIKDRYSLEFDQKTIEPWLVVATALLLDTGENR
jgi:uncharacterized protein YxjI